VVVIALAYGALVWEGGDIKKAYARRNVYDIEDQKEREEEYKFYATYNYENNISWRMFFIAGVIATLILYVFLKNYADPEQMELNSFVMFFIIFIVYYLSHSYRSFHLYRVMASKIKKDLNPMETMGGKKPKDSIFKNKKRKSL
jgi:hypothetical protein